MAKTMKMKHRYFKIGERVFNCDYKHSDNFDFGVISNINGKPESQVINAARSRTKVRRCHCPFFTERNKMKTKLFVFLTKTKKVQIPRVSSMMMRFSSMLKTLMN